MKHWFWLLVFGPSTLPSAILRPIPQFCGPLSSCSFISESGGKDSCYNMMQCVAAGHEIVALANLKPPESQGDELDSYMYQTVGHQALELYAEAMELPLYRASLQGTSLDLGRTYTPQAGDEVEDLYHLLKLVKEKESVDSVSVGAILSDYQRVRVENVCQRLGLQPFAFLWRQKQENLLDEMISCGLQAILIKVAAFGLDPDKHLGKTLQEMRPHLHKLSSQYGINVCGEGGEYETLTLDCPLFKKKIIVDSSAVIMHSNDAFAPVAYLKFLNLHLEDKVGVFAPDLEGKCACFDERPTDLVLHDEDHNTVSWTPQDLSMVPSCEVKKSSSLSPYGFWWVSEVACGGDDICCASESAFASLKDHVVEMGFEMKDAVLLCLYVRNMEDFAAINNIYKTFFPEAPPSRVCVQCCLPNDTVFKLDGLFWHSVLEACREDHTPEKISMHVQSISHWAPANIGPYSQAVRVDSTIFCAGQIALKPCSMLLVPGGVTAEVGVSLRHVERVLDAMCPGISLCHVLLAHCYVTQASYIPTARTAWRSSQKDFASCLSVVVVPKLPRGASVEWHVVASASDPQTRRCISLTEADMDFQAELYGVVSSCSSSASFTVSLSMHLSGVPCQDWFPLRKILCTLLHKAANELPSERPLTPICCRTFYRCKDVESQGLQTALQDVLQDVWGFRAPALALVPVSALSKMEVLHLSFWFCS
uniref:Diphthine--ammonia ligase n=1 Tax=Leptobrachium leishanense TaxID=445787 RepID=A0A8C5QX08_9ANUR